MSFGNFETFPFRQISDCLRVRVQIIFFINFADKNSVQISNERMTPFTVRYSVRVF